MVQPYPRTWAEINLDALTHNLAAIRRALGPHPEIAIVAKADGYGHGLVPIARHALRHGADRLAVATIQEAIALRDAGIDGTVMAMSPCLTIEAEQAAFYGIEVFIEDAETLRAFDEAGRQLGRKVGVHLKVDSGMHRFGCDPGALVNLVQAALGCEFIQMVGIAHHLADASNDVAVHEQSARFAQAIAAVRAAGLPTGKVHAAASGGALRFPDIRFDLVRIGLVAYGLDPAHWLGGQARPLLHWKARIIALRDVAPGEYVGYLRAWTAIRPTRVATIGAGYGDGYARSLSNKGMVRIGEHLAPVIGMVCMDQLMVDVTDIPEVAVGDVVTLLGPGVPASRLAELSQTNTHEVVCRLMTRVPRRYLHLG